MSTKPVDRRAFLRMTGAGLAATAIAGRSALAAPSLPVAAPIQRLNDALIAAMKAGRTSPFIRRYNGLEPAVEQAFDLDAILRVSVGPRWAVIPSSQQEQLQTAFRRYTIATYTANFDSYNGQRFEIEPGTRSVGAGEQVITTHFVPADSSSPTTLSYVMRQTPSGWKAVDVLAEGSISRVATQRSDFRELLVAGGGPALVASLQRKVADLSGGALA